LRREPMSAMTAAVGDRRLGAWQLSSPAQHPAHEAVPSAERSARRSCVSGKKLANRRRRQQAVGQPPIAAAYRPLWSSRVVARASGSYRWDWSRRFESGCRVIRAPRHAAGRAAIRAPRKPPQGARHSPLPWDRHERPPRTRPWTSVPSTCTGCPSILDQHWRPSRDNMGSGHHSGRFSVVDDDVTASAEAAAPPSRLAIQLAAARRNAKAGRRCVHRPRRCLPRSARAGALVCLACVRAVRVPCTVASSGGARAGRRSRRSSPVG